MSICLRPMAVDDYDAVLKLWQESAGLGDLESPDEFSRFLNRNSGLNLVAVEEGSLIGAVFCGQDGRRGYLYHLAVANEHRRRGIARQLVDGCLESLRELGIPRCSVHLYCSNEIGSNFWRGAGWRERTDLVVFARDLLP